MCGCRGGPPSIDSEGYMYSVGVGSVGWTGWTAVGVALLAGVLAGVVVGKQAATCGQRSQEYAEVSSEAAD